ncbi:PepSY-associated TM helix domain-containing protein [Chitinophaga nivalis]|uniref:PepSY domain-containing protein n=1 Tax=Chitinophaga nivalis TaxID=2991709 RepID=A0ABT3IM04_9BACT|nr:PepSY-associated TM helix domain-containing protein [Chitinophaga nivalis]MCW3465311.1 PepSY domain-containing protein [Chitinophaga nivalis]MCW3484997.1 PepSY domain-containing protein [Chitinophaga nivalis]
MLKLFKKINAWLHLWLGLISGIIIVFVSLTGCVLVFKFEIIDLTHPERRIPAMDESRMLPPSALHAAATAALPGKEVHSIWYHGLDRAAHIDIAADTILFMNPYTGKVIAMDKEEHFFHFIEDGHRHLWMGRKIGGKIIGWSTFVFLLLLISGLILWYPKKWNKAGVNNSLKIKWSARFKRLNYDLHNVLGFYSLLLAILMAATGLVMSFSWFSKSLYWITGGVKTARVEPAPIQPHPAATIHLQVDKAWNKVRHEVAQSNKNDIIVGFPDEPDEAIYLCTDMINGQWRNIYMDPNTLEVLPYSGKKIQDLRFADQVRTSNYALHVGAIGGMTTKILYFLASLICTSLPITGFYIWWHRGKKKTSKTPAKKLQVE